VIESVVETLKHFARPATVTFFIAVLGGGVLLAFVKRTQRLARWYFLLALTSYWLIASPAFAEWLAERYGRGYRPIATAAEARGATIVVVLGAGNDTLQAGGLTLNRVPPLAALRVMEGARLYTLLNGPTIIASGGVTSHDEGARPEGEGLRTAIVELGVPLDHIMVEAESQNTRDEAFAVARMIKNRPKQPIVVVTSATHMERALSVFRAAGLDPVPSASPYKSDHTNERLRWVPNEAGIKIFDGVLYDVAATWYYRMRGWMPN
jgi:uncharacterized SAM-binding protein YcdF (DUF218 family)